MGLFMIFHDYIMIDIDEFHPHPILRQSVAVALQRLGRRAAGPRLGSLRAAQLPRLRCERQLPPGGGNAGAGDHGSQVPWEPGKWWGDLVEG